MNEFTINVGGDIFADISMDNETITHIAHGVNTRGVMGGFAALIDKGFPEDAAEYRAACERGDIVAGGAFFTAARGVDGDPNLWIAHVVSQREPGPDARVEWLISGLTSMYAQIIGELTYGESTAGEVRLPLIGGGIGGIVPMAAATVIRACAETAARNYNIRTVLYLLDNDPATESIAAALGGADNG